MDMALIAYILVSIFSNVYCIEVTEVVRGQFREQTLIISGIDDSGMLNSLISDNLGNSWPVRIKYDKLVSFVNGENQNITNLISKRQKIGKLLEWIISSSPGMIDDNSLFKCRVNWNILPTDKKSPVVKLVDGKYIDFSDGSVVVDNVFILLRHKEIKLDELLISGKHP